jgi:hypothetical protein
MVRESTTMPRARWVLPCSDFAPNQLPLFVWWRCPILYGLPICHYLPNAHSPLIMHDAVPPFRGSSAIMIWELIVQRAKILHTDCPPDTWVSGFMQRTAFSWSRLLQHIIRSR